jgi:hypothetical protein
MNRESIGNYSTVHLGLPRSTPDGLVSSLETWRGSFSFCGFSLLNAKHLGEKGVKWFQDL